MQVHVLERTFEGLTACLPSIDWKYLRGSNFLVFDYTIRD